MNIQNSISSRRNALLEYYNLPEEARQKADAFFARVEQFGQECADQADFETRFLASPLNEEYNNLFVEFAPYVKTPEGTLTPEEQQKSVTKGMVESGAKGQVRRGIRGMIFRMLPQPLHDLKFYGIYRIPILGQIASAINNWHQVKRYLKPGVEPPGNEEDSSRFLDSATPRSE